MVRGMVYKFHIIDNRIEMRFFESCCDGSEKIYGARGNKCQKSA